MDKREKADEHPGQQNRVSRFVEFFERASQPEPNEVKRKSDKNRRRTDEMSDGDSDGLVVAERKRSGKRKHRKVHKKQKKAKKHKRHKHHRTDDTESDDSQRKTFDSENSEEENKDGKEEEDEAAGGELVGGRSSAKDLDQQQQYRPRYESPERGRILKDERRTASQLRGCGEADYTDLHKSSEYDDSKSRFQGHGSQRRAYDERLTTRDEYRRQPPDRHYSGSTRYSALSRYSGERSRKPSEPRGGREVTMKGSSDHQRRRSTPSSASPDERRFDAASYYRWHDESGRHPYHSRRIDHRRSRSGPRDEREGRVQRGPDHRREHGYSQEERSARSRPAKDERFARQAASRWDSPGGKEYREQRNSPDYGGSNRYYGGHKTEARMSGRKRFCGEREPTRDEYRHKSPEYSHSAPNSSADIPRRSANGDYRERYSGERSCSGIRKQREPYESAVSRTENGRPRHRSSPSQNDDRRSDRNDAGRTKQQRRSGSRTNREERGSQHETDHRRAMVGNRSAMHSTSHATDRRLERLPHSPGERLQRKISRSPPRSSLHDGGVKTEGHPMVKVEKQSGGHDEVKKEPKVGEQEQSKSGKLAVDRPEKNQQQRFGKNGDSEAEDGEPQAVEKQKPNFALSGKLTEETNKVNGVVIMYSEPPGARKPKRRWRLYPFKGDQALPTLYIHRQSCYLIGRDRKICDLPIDHPSCSKQHAVIQYRLVANEREDGSTGKCVRPYIIDLESANGTFVNYKQIEPKRYLQLFEKDVLKFGFSSREYVLLDENSKEQQQEDEENDERLDEIT
ncbi:probable serine/threonine-protein kinase DDB_G0280133 isoform X2 [Anopheles bellator]|uniref:probable serine/threonine-protein kinase DDB_G0280133 isoform X2 n=1 Tax=Anopheles bellator TaxID=139047 RepID=UPI002649789C|nr:probable serine/threonine-protein kinase DDB_G0280133 isoform X2 [Anopheles bellator]